MNDILTPCILQTVIICCTIIILGIVGVAAYRISKGQKRTWGSYIFSASIILTIAISIFSLCFCKNRNVLDFISLASAIISIILAVVTIVYSYFINSRSSGQIDQLNKAAQDVSKATLAYEKSAECLQENIKEILKQIKGISYVVGVDKDYENVGELKNVDTNTGSEVDEFKEEVISEFNKGNSNAGVIILYLCSKVKETEKECALNDLFEDDTIMYFFGYIIALNIIGFTAIDIDIATKTIKSADIVEDLIEGAKDRLSIETKNKFIKEHKQKIDEYFSTQEDISKEKESSVESEN